MSKHLFADIRIPIEPDNPAILRKEERCIRCGACRRVCEQEIAVGRMYDMAATKDMAVCIHCGQCANACPADSITERYEYPQVRRVIQDPESIVIFSTSPSVRVALGEEFGLPAGSFVEGSMVAALRALGASYVLDTNFSADLTIMEEAAELVERITKKTAPLPQFTSCCPAWVKFAETFYPALLPHISSAKSPIGMQGPTIKTYFAKANGLDPRRIINVAVTPCTAKKFEIRREEMNAASKELGAENLRDMDYVITTRELALWMKEDGIDFASLVPSEYDKLLGPASGAGVIFGNTGGVMEAAARTAYFLITGKNPPAGYLRLAPVRGMQGVREATVEIGGLTLKLAVAHGEANAKELAERVLAKKADYDFIEIMNCRGGCIGGGGQPKTSVPPTDEVLQSRIAGLYCRDDNLPLRYAHENPDIAAVYRNFYTNPLSARAEAMLHTVYHSRAADLGIAGKVEKPLTYPLTPYDEAESPKKEGDTFGNMQKRWKCSVCGYIHEGEAPPASCPVCGVGAGQFVSL